MPKKLYTKYHSYDKNTDTLIVSFASDETESKNPEDYPPVVVRPSMQYPDVLDQKELEKQIASMGYNLVVQQKAIEDAKKGLTNSKLYESLVSKGATEYNLDD